MHMRVCIFVHAHTHTALFYDTGASQIPDTFISFGLEEAAAIMTNNVYGTQGKWRGGI